MKRSEIAKTGVGRPVTLALAFTVVCGGSASGVAQTFVPERIATVQVPLSASGSIALLSDRNTACVIDSYEVRVRCVNRTGEAIGVFGREGEGPGEFGGLSQLVGGPDNTLGAVDNRHSRFSVFEPSGVLVGEVGLPDAAFLLGWVGRFDTTLSAIWVSVDPNVLRARTESWLPRLFEVELASSEVVWQEVPPVEAEVECREIIYGVPNPDGGWVYVACDGHMVFAGEDGEVAVLQAPTYTGGLPNERDVDSRREASRTTGRFGGGIGRAGLEQYQNTPKNYHLVLREYKFDEQGRFWIATQRDRDEFSYLDVYLPGEAAFVGSVRVNDRIMGFDLLGSTLVVVVERQLSPEDPDGIAGRAVDWYDVSEWR